MGCKTCCLGRGRGKITLANVKKQNAKCKKQCQMSLYKKIYLWKEFVEGFFYLSEARLYPPRRLLHLGCSIFAYIFWHDLYTEILNQCQTNLESKYLKMTFKLFSFLRSIFVSLELFSLSWSVSLKAKISEKKHFFSLRSEKKIGVFSLIFALSENERRTLTPPSDTLYI